MSVQDSDKTIGDNCILSFNTSYVSVQGRSISYLNSSTHLVSIHPMCRFKRFLVALSNFVAFVSIHPMCRFKYLSIYFTPYLNLVSIHPMCRFKQETKANLDSLESFNTSYVSVQVSV